MRVGNHMATTILPSFHGAIYPVTVKQLSCDDNTLLASAGPSITTAPIGLWAEGLAVFLTSSSIYSHSGTALVNMLMILANSNHSLLQSVSE